MGKSHGSNSANVTNHHKSEKLIKSLLEIHVYIFVCDVFYKEIKE